MSDKILTFGAFAKTIAGTADEVWLRFLRIEHSAERHSESEWKAMIKHYGKQPANAKPVKFGK
jgi:hypothetical protein